MVTPYVFTGAECSAKSVLSSRLAQEVNAAYLPEYAREYLRAKEGRYSRADFEIMLEGQYQRQEQLLRAKPEVMQVWDTDLLNYLVWAEFAFPDLVDRVYQSWQQARPAQYFLCHPDLPWEPDPLRESPFQRPAIFERHRFWLHRCARPYREVWGSGEARWRSVLKAFQDLD